MLPWVSAPQPGPATPDPVHLVTMIAPPPPRVVTAPLRWAPGSRSDPILSGPNLGPGHDPCPDAGGSGGQTRMQAQMVEAERQAGTGLSELSMRRAALQARRSALQAAPGAHA